ncbi:MAG TPA: hypothetical protein VL899_08530 [Alphaproteobacteria bacterium]|jgi:hypothetical protein|nr:hypothetical protein [Alphaproteobacteria bacterium]
MSSRLIAAVVTVGGVLLGFDPYLISGLLPFVRQALGNLYFK